MTTGDERPLDGTRPEEPGTAGSPDQPAGEAPAASAPPAGWAPSGETGTDGHTWADPSSGIDAATQAGTGGAGTGSDTRADAGPGAGTAPWASVGSGADAATQPALPANQVGFGPEPRRRPWGLIGIAAGVVLALLVGGVVFAIGKLSGGGTQPEELVPASAFAFAKLDLDPAAGQKVAAMQFLRHFPAAADALGDNEDIREVIFGQAAEDAGLDYAEDVEPWLGDRFAVAAIPGPAGESPDFAVYVQVSDQEKAAEHLPEMVSTDAPGAVTFRRGYAIVSQDQSMLERVEAAATDDSLAADSEFEADMADLGGDEVAAAWVDVKAVIDAVVGSTPGLPADQQEALDAFQGRIAITARFTDSYAEVFGRTVGFDAAAGLTQSAAKPVGPVMRNLPPNTGAALAISGIGSGLEQNWPDVTEALGQASGDPGQIDAVLADFEDRYDLDLPADLATLFGEPTLFALDLESFQGAQLPLVGMRAVTDPSAAESVVQKVLSLLEFEFGVDVASLPVHWATAGDSLYVTSDAAYTAALQQGGEVADPAFDTALPDLDTAQVALWVDVDGLFESTGEGIDDEVAPHIAGIGVTAGYEDSGNATFRLRVVAD